MDHVNVYGVFSSCCENGHFVKKIGLLIFRRKMKSGHTVGDGCPGHVAICEKYKLPMLHETVAEEVWIAVGWTIGTRRNAVFGVHWNQ